MLSPRLTRSRRDKVIAGVCGGLAQYFEVDATLVRLIFVILFFSGFVAVPLYVVLWFIMPKEPREEWATFGRGSSYGGRSRTWAETGGAAPADPAGAQATSAAAGVGNVGTMPRPEVGDPGLGAPTGPAGADRFGPSGFGVGGPGSSAAYTAGPAGSNPYANPEPPFGPYPWIEADLAASKERRRPALLAVLLIGAGLLLLANNLGLFTQIKWGVIWPAALIVLGLALLLSRRRGRRPW